MEQKKVLKVWQMVLILVLLVGMFATMFLPVFRFNGKAVGKMYSYVVKNLKDETEGTFFSDLLNEALEDEMSQEDMDEIDEEIADLEEDNGIKISSITPIRIMGNSLTSFMLGKDAEQDDIDEFEEDLDEDFKGLNTGYNALRISFVLIYVMCLIVIVLLICGFACKWNKLIPIMITMIYSFISLVVFAVLRFGLMRIIAGKLMDTLEEFMDDIVGLGSTSGNSDAFAKMLSYLYSVSFIVALIIALLILVACIVSLVTGNKVVSGDYNEYNSYGMDSYGMDSYGMDSEGTQLFSAYGGNNFASGTDSGNQGDYFESNSYNDTVDISSVSGNNDYYPESIPVTQYQPAASADILDTPITPIPKSAPATPVMPTAPAVPVQSAMGKVLCTKGIALGKGFQLPQNRKVVVGKNSKKANLVISDQHVSNVHCSIQYNPGDNTYSVIDYSSNGTYVNGVKMQKEVPTVYPAGTVLCLANGNNEITLG